MPEMFLADVSPPQDLHLISKNKISAGPRLQQRVEVRDTLLGFYPPDRSPSGFITASAGPL